MTPKEQAQIKAMSGRWLALLAVLMAYLFMVAKGTLGAEQAMSVVTLVIGYYFGGKGKTE